jgi:hypothetical protein
MAAVLQFELGRALYVAIIRDQRQTRFYHSAEGWLRILKQRFPNDEMIYVYCDGEPSQFLLAGRDPPFSHKPFQPSWYDYDIKQGHIHLLRMAGDFNATIHSYIPEPTTAYGFMYAFEHKEMGWIKVGMTNKPDETYCRTRIHHYCRVRSLPENGWELRGIVKTAAPAKLEDRMHRKLRQYRVTQEDGETELFKCDVSVYQAALASLDEFIVSNKPRTTAEAVAHVEALRARTTQENAARHQQVLKAEENRKKREQRKRREAEQRAAANEQYRQQRAAEKKATEISRLTVELAQLQAKESQPRGFDFGGKARRQRIAAIQDQLKVLE